MTVAAAVITLALPQLVDALRVSQPRPAAKGSTTTGSIATAIAGPAMNHPVVPAAAYRFSAPKLSRASWVFTRSTAPSTAVIDLLRTQAISALEYDPRGRTGPAVVQGYQLFASTNRVDWTRLGYGTWAADQSIKTASFAPVRARFVKLVSTAAATAPSATRDGTYPVPSAAQLDLFGTPTALASSGVKPQTTPTTTATASSGSLGSWGPVIGFPLVPVAAAMLPNNKLLTWSSTGPTTYGGGGGYTHTAILDLATGSVSQQTVSNTGHDMFCTGIALLSDGRVLVSGGSPTNKTSIYDPTTNTWQPGPNMGTTRWYNATTLLSNGNAFTFGGSWGSNTVGNNPAEVYAPSTNSWQTLSAVQSSIMLTAYDTTDRMRDNHGWLIATSNGTVLQAGPSKQMNWINTGGSGTVTPAGMRADSDDAMNGNAVYYDINKILTLGGAPQYTGVPATNRAYTIDISGGKAVTRRVGDLNFARAFSNSVVLPDGTVVVIGGMANPVLYSDAGQLVPELWNPATGTFSQLAPMAIPRDYHSVAVLLPDGRVFSGGGGLCGTCSTNHLDGQIFTPPYLLNADGSLRPRPSIIKAPSSTSPGSTITVTTDRSVASYSLVRLGEATHSVDNDQRRVPLHIKTSNGTTARLIIPTDPGVVLPGYYMLFALDGNGVPSVSKIVRIG